MDRAGFDSFKGSGPDCITAVVLQTCKPELLYILVYFFHVFSKLLKSIICGCSAWRCWLKTTPMQVFFTLQVFFPLFWQLQLIKLLGILPPKGTWVVTLDASKAIDKAIFHQDQLPGSQKYLKINCTNFGYCFDKRKIWRTCHFASFSFIVWDCKKRINFILIINAECLYHKMLNVCVSFRN